MPPPLHPRLGRPELGIEPVPDARSVAPLHHATRETALSPVYPIAQGRETSLSPWTVPSTSRFAAGPRVRPPAALAAAMAAAMMPGMVMAIIITVVVVLPLLLLLMAAMMPGMMMIMIFFFITTGIVIMPTTKEARHAR